MRKNYGVIIKKPEKTAWIAGQESGIAYREVNPSGDWSLHLPDLEQQNSVYFDSSACVSFSALNCIETQLNYLISAGQIPEDRLNKLVKWGYVIGGRANFSDRFTAKMSGTTRRGNSLQAVWDSIRHHGLVPEKMWGYPRLQAEPVFDFDEYYRQIPQNVIDFGRNILEIIEFKYELVNAGNCYPNLEALKKELKHAPLQAVSLVCKGWDGNGIVMACGCGSQHATMVYGIDSVIYDYDSYDRYLKALAKDYGIPWIMKGVVELRAEKKPVDEQLLPLTKDLHFGMSDREVVHLKRGLRKLGFLTAKINDTEFFGTITKNAVLKYQRKKGICKICLWQGKKVGLSTRTKINQDLML